MALNPCLGEVGDINLQEGKDILLQGQPQLR